MEVFAGRSDFPHEEEELQAQRSLFTPVLPFLRIGLPGATEPWGISTDLFPSQAFRSAGTLRLAALAKLCSDHRKRIISLLPSALWPRVTPVLTVSCGLHRAQRVLSTAALQGCGSYMSNSSWDQITKGKMACWKTSSVFTLLRKFFIHVHTRTKRNGFCFVITRTIPVWNKKGGGMNYQPFSFLGFFF